MKIPFGNLLFHLQRALHLDLQNDVLPFVQRLLYEVAAVP